MKDTHRMAAAFILFGTAAGCGGMDPDAGMDAGSEEFFGQGSEESDEVGVARSALSNSEECDTVSANRTTTGLPQFNTGSSYGTTGCHKAYRLDAMDYVPGKVVTVDVTPGVRKWYWVEHYFEYGDSVPDNKAECEKLRFGVYAWDKNELNQFLNFLGKRWAWGYWDGSQCIVPRIFPVNDFMPWAEDVRFAMSARRYSVAKDSESSYTRKKISSWYTQTEL